MTDNKLIDKLDNDNIPVFSVSDITQEITGLLETKYSYVKIKGEISGETGNKYPEIYFTLKDNENVISAIIKRNKISNLKFLPEDGLEVICTGKITAYTKRDSKFQIDVDSISVEGEGQLLRMKEELRRKLEDEGLFDVKYKKDIPFIPKKIGIITSPSGSVIKDMQRIIFEKFSVPIELYGATVQGEKAIKEIKDGIEYFVCILDFLSIWIYLVSYVKYGIHMVSSSWFHVFLHMSPWIVLTKQESSWSITAQSK